MIDQKEVNLLVRANFRGKQTMQEVTKSLTDVEGALEKQTAAAKRGESSIDELKASQQALLNVQQKLADNAKLISAYAAISKGMDDARKKVADTTEAFEKQAAVNAKSAAVTKTQEATLARLERARDRATASLARQVESEAKLSATLKASGVDLNNLAAANDQIVSSAIRVGQGLRVADEAIKTYSADVRDAREATAALKRDQEAFARAEALANAQRASRVKAAAEVEEMAERRRAAAASRNNEVAAAARSDAQLQEQTKRQRELLELRRDIEARSARSAQDDSLNKTAADAQRAAKEYTSLARAATDLTPKVESLRDVVNRIVDPAERSRNSLDGVEKKVAELSATIAKSSGPVKDYEKQFRALVDAQKSLGQQANLIDTFRKQIDAVRTARTEFSAARAQVQQYAAAMRQGGEAGASFAKPLAEAEVRLRAASAALSNNIAQTRATRDSLLQAGISTQNLSGAQERLINATQKTAAATKQLTASVEEFGQAAQRSRKGGGLFGDEGRTTLSFVQRLRGEILALTAAFVGLQGVQNLAGGAIEASKGRESARTVLGVGLGTTDPKQIDAEYAYVKGQADRIGLVFSETVKEFGKFSTAAAKSGRSRQEIRAIFEAFAEGGRVLNLTTADMNGVFLALTQIFSKGKLGAEELRQQLGERLPGVFEVAQQALKKQFPDLNKAMEEGKVGAENLILVADEYRKMVADQLPNAQKSLSAQQARLTNEVNNFKLAVADAGWVDAYAEAIKKITDFLKSEDGKKFAESASAGLTALAKLLVVVLDNFDTVKLAAEAFLIIWGGTRLLSALDSAKKAFTEYFENIKNGTAKAGIDFKSFTGIVTTGLAVVQAAVIGWEIGSYLYKKFQTVRDAGTWLVTGLAEVWAFIKGSFEYLWDNFPDIAYNAFAKVVNNVNKLASKLGGIFADLADAAGMENVGTALRAATRVVELPLRDMEGAAVRARAKVQAEVARIKSIREDMLRDSKTFGKEMNVEPTPTADPTPSPGLQAGKPKGPSEGDIKKRQNAIEAITKALETLESKIDRAQTKNLQAQLDAVDQQYAALKRKIDGLGGKEEAQFMKQLGQLTGELKSQIVAKFNKDLATEYENITKKIEAADAAAGRRSKRELDGRLDAISSSYEATYREIAEYRKVLEANNMDVTPADDAKTRLDATIVELKRLEQIKFATEELRRREAEVNLQIEARGKLIESVQKQREVGAITDEAAAQRINQINQAAVPQIQAAVDKTLEWARANEAVFNNPEQMDAFIQKLQAIGLSAAQVQTQFGLLGTTVINGTVNTINSGLSSIVNSLGQVATGQMTVSEGFKSILSSFAGFAASFLQEIAVMIMKMLIFRALAAVTGMPGVAAVGTAGLASMGASVKHDGGLVGRASGRSRTNVPAALFANAPRYHTGGVPNLSANEYATILKKNEEVLTEDDPRNILNGGGLGGKDESGNPRGLKVVLVDDRDQVAEAMNSSAGDKVVVQAIKRNAAGVRSVLRG